MDSAGITLLQIGIILTIFGGLLGTILGLPLVKERIGSHLLEEARRQLYDRTSLLEGDPRFDAILRVVEEHWGKELD